MADLFGFRYFGCLKGRLGWYAGSSCSRCRGKFSLASAAGIAPATKTSASDILLMHVVAHDPMYMVPRNYWVADKELKLNFHNMGIYHSK